MAAKNLSPTTKVIATRCTTKCIYDAAFPQDGVRILVMRFWPRVVPKTAVDRWFRELGTAPALIQEWKQEKIRWTEFRRAYQRGLQDPAARQAITEIRKLLSEKPVTLLCSCREEARCHRGILKQAILQQPIRVGAVDARNRR
jgi:uncharacterized protein YeaO (DUF488 family)